MLHEEGKYIWICTALLHYKVYMIWVILAIFKFSPLFCFLWLFFFFFFLESPDEASKAQDNSLNLVLRENHLHWSNKVDTLHMKHTLTISGLEDLSKKKKQLRLYITNGVAGC